ncbi:hypothetical protein SLNWT_1728 [Streptomyces albus]|uniref:Uncharacterized protein n=1 Tax=Streptomyces albus (strain ATCC 21838 / DSM 41398 / FERM P-419 / JCM 4703 / NBRC 107858) TaxID=1081613 RepID=A0A0B5EKP7_STRA4|nr:hypothetical protein SLNWT_1728 [Streptomyces albus]
MRCPRAAHRPKALARLKSRTDQGSWRLPVSRPVRPQPVQVQ